MFVMDNEQINCAYLESLAFSDLVKLADEYGIDVPQDLDRRFLIAELLEIAQEESNRNDLQMIISDEEENPENQNLNLNLPKNYNETQIAGILRNPAWLFVFWNISVADDAKIKSKNSSIKIRVCSYEKIDDTAPCDSFEVQPADEIQEQYILLPKGIKFLKAELISAAPGFSDVLAVSSVISVPETSFRIKNLNFGEENDFSPILQLSGIKDVIIEHYKNHRQSFM